MPSRPSKMLHGTPPRSVSVLTIASGRAAHLANVIRGLDKQMQPPLELVIGVMQEELYEGLPETGFPIRQVRVPGASRGRDLPLAAARNAAAAAARGEVLAFLDIDCIPAPSLVADYARHAAPGAGLMMGEVMYLPGGALDDGIDYAAFDAICQRHSDRRAAPAEGTEPCNDYRCFWSLNFALHAEDYAASGGFDERFRGYGGEDTDFGKTLSMRGIAINWMARGRVYHQYHPHHMPPVHHLHSVLRNAELFAEKWGYRTMEHWLHAFRMMGLIENGPDGLRVLREPGEAEFELSGQQSHQPYANTRRVLKLLEARAGGTPIDEHESWTRMQKAQNALLARPATAAE
ncbi:glycosyltransferase family 2 protein [Profundibacterium mesophilum]|uniref:Glycosyl transferase n=1 Tax=Profundibacterium mesophilum KAUST100406-0324 TaxID=1037889 RepID=A0A921NQ37_9RHOB|nr:galactosyltransferase-related protein [Profundibacterium mesophilum]KAF0676012.1 glycosyl transferase [Profundibacterium mesophilum KAUST100406-0324]